VKLKGKDVLKGLVFGLPTGMIFGWIATGYEEVRLFDPVMWIVAGSAAVLFFVLATWASWDTRRNQQTLAAQAGTDEILWTRPVLGFHFGYKERSSFIGSNGADAKCIVLFAGGWAEEHSVTKLRFAQGDTPVLRKRRTVKKIAVPRGYREDIFLELIAPAEWYQNQNMNVLRS